MLGAVVVESIGKNIINKRAVEVLKEVKSPKI